MLELFLALGGGVLFSLLLRIAYGKPLTAFHRYSGWMLSLTLYLMLAVMGYQLGANPVILSSLPSVGGISLVISLAGITGSVFMAFILWKTGFLPSAPGTSVKSASAAGKESGSSSSLTGSALTLLSLGLGCVAGYFGAFPSIFDSGLDLPVISLYLLLVMAGVTMGSNPELRDLLKGLNPRLLLLPFASIAGTLLCIALVAFIVGLLPSSLSEDQPWTIWDYVTTGAGMGYYSLSSVLIGNLKEAVYGPALASTLAAIALVSNIIREVSVLVTAPLLHRIGGPYAPVAAAGATAADVCCPVLMRASGDWILPAVLISGFLTDFSVPFLVTWLSQF